MKKLRPSNIKSHMLISEIEKLRTPTLIHAFYCIPFTARPNGAPNSFPHDLCLQYSEKISYSCYTLILAGVFIPFHPQCPRSFC